MSELINIPTFPAYHWSVKKVSEWKKKQIQLKLRAKVKKYLWISTSANGLGLTYEKAKHGELKIV